MDNTELNAAVEEYLSPLHRLTPYLVTILVAVFSAAILSALI